jgi:BNR repeat-like domain
MSVISRRRWRMSIPLALILLALIASLVFALSSMGFTHAAGLVQISSDPYTNNTSNHKTQVEPDTFAFGTTVVSAFQSGRFFDGGASNIGFATSTNGGGSWIHGFLPGTTVFATPPGPSKYQRVSDASVAYDANHKVWIISYLAFFSGTSVATDVLVSRSTDGGLTWGLPVAVNTSGDSNDKNWTVCDDTASSPHFGNCYTEFDDFSKLNLVQMSTSTDGGLTWGVAKTTPDNTCVIGGQPVVQPNGNVIVPIDDCVETSLLSFRSTDGGQTWSKPVLAAQLLFDTDPGHIRAGPLPSAEIDSSGKVYVTWEDCRFENFCNAGNNDLVLTTSTDGLTWSPVTRIPIDAVGSGVDHLIPGLAVDRNTSGSSAHLGLAYYFFATVNCGTTHTPACQLNVGFISSTDGGNSWSTAQQLAGPMNLSWLPLTTQGFMVGDYISTSIVPGATDATPVFEVASAPTGRPTCSNLKTGAPGSRCNEPTFSDLLLIAGGTNVSNVASASLPTKKSGLSQRARVF